ncbi:MAG: hypothetical protein A3H98_02345 [Bacteroidetes bacterium RIFCSPLOWO2_02_FULL_36_8]|nr:MAG: hypothetical protein A3H98_02345 [Bacteroidetes bacterium RIFCSPLOWO2_02_FULL_36_8]OFY69235.1 MAG: hypothetical protein A3G23_06375 [Bacteroidetes bacterium RIFCSPLOWO2_12_FULL_37_12]
MKLSWNHIIMVVYIILSGCTQKGDRKNSIDIQGHRGCRGIMPENSVPAMIKALEIGVTTLEMDVIISKDKKVVVSHEPFLSHEICLTPEGKIISEKEEHLLNLYTMNYDEIRLCDCGTKPHDRFPEQQKIPVYKPLLGEVIDSSENYLRSHSLNPIWYNIEIKSSAETDSIFHPPVVEYAELVLSVIKEKNISGRVIIQSFDLRPLQYIHRKYPDFQLALLIETPVPAEKSISLLGFIPNIYSPDYTFVNKELINYAKKNNMKVIPWTVNEKDEILKLLRLGVNGIITDYPERVLEIILSQSLQTVALKNLPNLRISPS